MSGPYDPSGGETAEDDGDVLAYVHDPGRGASDPVTLAARSSTGEPVAWIRRPGRMPPGCHGSRVPDA